MRRCGAAIMGRASGTEHFQPPMASPSVRRCGAGSLPQVEVRRPDVSAAVAGQTGLARGRRARRASRRMSCLPWGSSRVRDYADGASRRTGRAARLRSRHSVGPRARAADSKHRDERKPHDSRVPACRSRPRDACRPGLRPGTRRPRGRAHRAATASTTCRRSRRRAASSSTLDDLAQAMRAAGQLPRSAPLDEVLANSAGDAAMPRKPWLLAPCDLQAIKAARRHLRRPACSSASSRSRRAATRRGRGGARRDRRADRRQPARTCSRDRRRRRALKEVLIAQGVWSQYLEVGIGPDAEIFTKAQPMSAVGTGADDRHASEVGVEQPGAGGRAGRQRRGRDRRRHARQRRQPARLRGPQRAAARQGQGQQRLVRDRPVHAPVRRALHARRRAPRRRRADASTAPTASRSTASSSMREISRDPADLVGAGDRRRTTSIPTASCCSSARCSRRRRTAAGRARASPTRSATSSPSPRRARRAGQPGRHSDRIRRGPSAPPH